MPVYAYQVRNTRGNIVNGSMEAASQAAVVERLRGQKYIVISLREEKPSLLAGLFKPKIKVKKKDVVVFSRQLATLVSAAVPIVQGLTILTEQIVDPSFKKVIEGARDDIESGSSIADALAKFPTVFDELYIHMIRAGEIGGVLDVILERLAGYLEASEQLKRRIKGAMTYPAVVSLAALGVTAFLLIFIVPRFQSIFAGMGAELPLPTQIVIKLSDLLKHYFLFMLGGLVLVFVALKQFHKTEGGSRKIDGLMLKLPVLGPLIRKAAIAKFTSTLGTLVKSGVPILQALETVAKTSGNKVIEDVIMDARRSIKEGERIATPLRASGVFPPMVVQMISVGEETGNLDTMLMKIAEFYNQEVDAAVGSLTAMLEPLVMVFLGVVAGGIVLSMYMPYFQMGELASKM